MLSLTKGNKIATIYQKNGNKKPIVKKEIKIVDDNFNESENKNLDIKIENGNNNDYVFPSPRKLSERIYISAPSGSGKSYFTALYLAELRKQKGQRKREIYIFSRVDEDKPLDKYEPIRIPLDRETFDSDPLQPEDFRGGIVVFDDIDTLMDKALLKYLQDFRDDLLECGRHYDITTISTTHNITNFKETRKLLNEANAIVIFPRSGGTYQLKGFLERYMGYSKEQIEIVRNLPSRWVYLWKEYPQYIVYEKGVKILSN